MGRYQVLSLLGVGGMGRVYAAYDPRLDRKVALKLLRRGAGAEDPSHQARLLREAQALARLNDPHVLTIYDVGTVDGQIFLAVEYVAGLNLADWLEAGKKTSADILRVFVEAGRGLAAAHRRGLVHRDVKPSNVMVRQDDGRALVLDFGLVRSGPAIDEPRLGEGVGLDTAAEETAVHRGDREGSTVEGAAQALTRAGALLGTPRYMAPEQWRGESGPEADQFGFCASLFEALYDEPPFGRGGSATAAALELAPEVPEGRDVPAPVRRAMLRGLALDPRERFSSMDALLRELQRDPRRRRRRLALSLSLAAAVALGVSAGLFGARGPRPCTGAEERMAEVWGPARRAELVRAFSVAGQPYGRPLTGTVVSLLDRTSRDWRETYRDACEATRVRGDQSSQLMDRRMACLEDRRRELASLVDLFLEEPGDTLGRAVMAIGDLSPLEACSDTTALMAPVALPENGGERAKISELRGELAQNRALRAAGRFREAADRAATLERSVRGIDYLPLQAEALLELGKTRGSLSQGESAADTLERAVWVAQASRHHRVGAEALTQLVRVAGHLLKDVERGDFFARLASSSLDQLDRAEELRARLADHRGVLEVERGRPERAVALHREALELHETRHGTEHPEVARSLIRLSTVLHDLGRYGDAAEHLERALAIQRRSLGPAHPDVAAGLDRLGFMAYRLGELEKSLAHFAEALEILTAAFGPDHVRVATTGLNAATVQSAAGRHRQALDLYDAARRTLEQAYGPQHPDVAAVWSNIGTTRLEVGELAAARDAYGRALAIQEATLGDAHPALATTHYNLGEVWNDLEDFRRGESSSRRALELWRSAHGADHFLLGHAHTGLGRALLGRGEKGRAAVELERALVLWEGFEQDPSYPGRTRWLLARAVVDLDRTRAQELARQALADYRLSPLDNTEAMAEIEAWLAATPEP